MEIGESGNGQIVKAYGKIFSGGAGEVGLMTPKVALAITTVVIACLLNPTEAAGKLHDSSGLQTKKTRVLSKADLLHGEQQVKAMIHDNPAMAKFVSRGDSVWNWTARQFAGTALGSRIFWNQHAAVPNLGTATNNYPIPGRVASITISKLEDWKLAHLDGEILWTAAVFELFNIQNGPKYYSLYKKACLGQITKEEWIRANTVLEFDSIKKTKTFYRTVWLPQQIIRKNTSNPAHWRANSSDVYDVWISNEDAEIFIRYWSSVYPR